MQELLTAAWQGWQRYTDSGKYVALLLLVLLFLWFRKEEEKEKLLLNYTTLVTFFCIFPISAAALMTYQTRFYDYEWIWNYVPLTMMIAYGGTLFLTKYWEDYKKNIWKCIGITLLVLAVIVLCGSMGQRSFGKENARNERTEAQQVLGLVLEETDRQDICLWAPREILETARAYDGNIRLVYGRNMWDAALGAYSYEIYGEAEESLYRWMSWIQESSMMGHFEGEPTTEDIVIGGAACIETAAELGVNTILLPDNILPEDLQALAELSDVAPVEMGNYYLVVLE